jgi:hypothetical protein
MSIREARRPDEAVATTRTLAQLRARTIELARLEPAPSRTELAARHLAVAAAALLFTMLLFVALGGVRVAPRPERLVGETVVGSAALAAGFAAIGFGRGRSMLGRPQFELVLAIVLAPVLLFSWRAFTSSRYPGMSVQWPDRPGLRCFALSMVLAVAPLIAAFWVRRNSDPAYAKSSAAALGTAVGAGVWVLVDLWCPVGYGPHVLLGHVVPLLLATAASALFGSRVLSGATGTSPSPPRTPHRLRPSP